MRPLRPIPPKSRTRAQLYEIPWSARAKFSFRPKNKKDNQNRSYLTPQENVCQGSHHYHEGELPSSTARSHGAICPGLSGKTSAGAQRPGKNQTTGILSPPVTPGAAPDRVPRHSPKPAASQGFPLAAQKAPM